MRKLITIMVVLGLAAVALGSWHWVNAPIRTARQFHDLVKHRRWAEAKEMIGLPDYDRYPFQLLISTGMYENTTLVFQHRSLDDVLRRRCSFFTKPDDMNSVPGSFPFAAINGRVVFNE